MYLYAYMCVCVYLCMYIYISAETGDWFETEMSWTRSPREEEQLFNAMWSSEQEWNQYFRMFWSTLQGSLTELLAMSH